MLDKFTLKILRYIKRNPDVTLDNLKTTFSDKCTPSVSHLWKEEYISNKQVGYHAVVNSPIYNNSYTITPKGLSYLEELPKNSFFKIYPLVISTLALIISALALLKSFDIIFQDKTNDKINAPTETTNAKVEITQITLSHLFDII
jgi:hypothetical protein